MDKINFLFVPDCGSLIVRKFRKQGTGEETMSEHVQAVMEHNSELEQLGNLTRRELKELEEKYAGKDIHFVSLSCDKNKKAWENMVTKEQLKGIQLHMGTDRTFMDAYLINGIPRFILLDRMAKSSLPI